PIPHTRGSGNDPTVVRATGDGRRRTGGTGPASRATTPRVGVDGHQTRAVPKSARACVRRTADPVADGGGTPGMGAPSRWAGRDRSRCNRVRFRQRAPRHQVWLHPFALASRPVTNGEWLAFIDDGGYQRPELWLSDGWATVQQHGWRAPSYWHQVDGTWQVFTLAGSRAVNPAEPVCHISYYEADAFAQWAGARLPTEFEWEAAATDRPVSGRLLDQQALHPRPAPETGGLQQMFGDVWEWTSSA